ncbi:MAG: peptidase domain-containing ABC transporter [Acidiferrobacter sp.]
MGDWAAGTLLCRVGAAPYRSHKARAAPGSDRFRVSGRVKTAAQWDHRRARIAQWAVSLRATSSASPLSSPAILTTDDMVWVLGSVCALHRLPFDAGLLIRQFPPPYTTVTLIQAARALGLRIATHEIPASALGTVHFPCIVLWTPGESGEDAISAQAPDPLAAKVAGPTPAAPRPGDAEGLLEAREADSEAPETELAGPRAQPVLLVQADLEQVTLFVAGTNTPTTLPLAVFAARYPGYVFQLALQARALTDPDGASGTHAPFGFRWFIPELLKHKRVWRDVLLASLVIQVLALAFPLFTQVIIDRVVVHRVQSTLIVIGVGMAIFLVFSALLSWVRQYLVLHTGNRVDAVLGSAVFAHLFKLPPRYFEHRPTGVITTRLQGVETIREFVASAAVTLILDLPFLLIFVAIMFDYSVRLTVIALAIIGVVVVLSLIVAPLFRTRLNDQFLLAARNQAFTTEYVAGLETVKSLQMEPMVNSRYHDYLAEYLRAGFDVRQIANTYNVLAGALEQTLSLVILIVGADLVMNGTDFTIGMLVAFQMFASRLSQPMMRLVGLWQQFQQARLSVLRLGDVMNAPPELYTLLPRRTPTEGGAITLTDVSFRYGDDRPFLYEGLNVSVPPGQVVAITGPSGCGKSTLAKLLQGFYLPTTGTITVGGHDIRHLSANELRAYFGVVPQETILFSGTVYENLLMANPHATFAQVVKAAQRAEIHTVIEQLPQGYETEIGERGAGLSGGQKQRLAIARALLKEPAILLFDEATSNLDHATAEQFAKTINQLRGQVTMLFISHGLPKALQVDAEVALDSLRPKGRSEPTTQAPRVRAFV